MFTAQHVKYLVLGYIALSLFSAAGITFTASLHGDIAPLLWLFSGVCYLNAGFGLWQWMRLQKWSRKQQMVA